MASQKFTQEDWAEQVRLYTNEEPMDRFLYRLIDEVRIMDANDYSVSRIAKTIQSYLKGHMFVNQDFIFSAVDVIHILNAINSAS